MFFFVPTLAMGYSLSISRVGLGLVTARNICRGVGLRLGFWLNVVFIRRGVLAFMKIFGALLGTVIRDREA